MTQPPVWTGWKAHKLWCTQTRRCARCSKILGAGYGRYCASCFGFIARLQKLIPTPGAQE